MVLSVYCRENLYIKSMNRRGSGLALARNMWAICALFGLQEGVVKDG
jgi:hypothetical protein